MSKSKGRRKLAKAIKFAALRTEGKTQLEAWRAIHPDWSKSSQQVQHVMASQFAADPLVTLKCAEALQNANLNAMMSAPRYTAWLQDRIGDAQARENDTAVMAGARVLGQALGHLRDNLTVDSKNIPIDKLAADLIAGGLPEAFVRRKLGIAAANALPIDGAAAVIPIKSKA
jgi:hypothetical protein